MALVISSLALGGAEKTLCVLAGGLARRGCEVHVLSFDAPQAAPFFPLDPRVRLHGLDLNRPSASALRALGANARRVAVLRRHLRQLRPQAVIGFMDSTNVLCLLACLGLGIPVLATEHTDPRRHDIGAFWNTLRRLTYPLAAAVTTQTKAVLQLLPGRCVLLANPVEQPVAPPPRQGPAPAEATFPQGKLLLALGRLAPEKGFDLLLEAFAALAGSRPQWSLVILGEGPERQRLEAQRRALGLEGRVLLPGATAEPSAWLRRAELFALASRFEGFSNALCEALACGVPAVAFDCQSGPAEILRHGVDGLLVAPEDVPALTAALGRLMDDEPLRRAMAARAPEVLERYGLETVLDQWEALLAQAQAEDSSPPQARVLATLSHLFTRLWRMLRTSGPAPDGPRCLRLLETHGRLKTFLLRFLRLRVSPDALPRLRGLRAPLDERARLFRSAISLLNVNETYKTTGSDRTRLADEMLLGLIPALGCATGQATSQTTSQSPGPLRLLDIGVSDGSASVALLARLPKGSEAILTDLHPVLHARGPAGFRLFLDARQRLLGVKVLGLYLNLSLSLHASARNFETIDTINPLLQERLGIAAIRPFNALTDALPEPVQLIKCANVLNRGYFADAALLAAARNLARSLADGGFLVISQNNAAYPGGEACFALQRRGARLLLAAQVNGHLALPLFEAGVELGGQPDCGQPTCEQGNSKLDYSGQPRPEQDGSQRDDSRQNDSGRDDSGQGGQTPKGGGPCAC